MFDDAYARSTLEALRSKGTAVGAGLAPDHLERIESAFECPMPPELRTLLAAGVPQGGSWTDWSRDPAELAADARAWMVRTFDFDIRKGQYWSEQFGERPEDDDEAVRVATEIIDGWPRMFPIYSHRFVTTTPAGPSHPVLSVYQAVDSIYYGFDMADYLHHEFEVPKPSWSLKEPPPVPYWGVAFELL